MKAIQEKIKRFDDERDWSSPSQVKDLLLNMNEEIGELWTIIKWVDTAKQQELIAANQAEVDNFIGDMMFLVLKVASLCKVDAEKATLEVLAEYEKRFPVDKTRGNHANKRAGGIDLKDES
jgi:dCTP diphosphatase